MSAITSPTAGSTVPSFRASSNVESIISSKICDANAPHFHRKFRGFIGYEAWGFCILDKIAQID
jgi:hypothetical protein